MGGDPIKSVEHLLGRLFVALDQNRLDQIERLLQELPLDALSPQELQKLQRGLDELQKRVEKEQKELLRQMQDVEKLKKFRY